MKLGIGLNIHNKKTGSGLSASYKAVLEYATTNAYTVPSADVQVIQNNFIATLENLEIISNLDYLYLFANNGYDAFARINMADTSRHYCLKNGEILHNNKLGYGIDPGGSTGGYMDPQYLNRLPPNGQAIFSTQNDAIFGFFITQLNTNKNFIAHKNGVTSGNSFWIRGDNNFLYGGIWSTTDTHVTYIETPGLYYVRRVTATSADIYFEDNIVFNSVVNSSSYIANSPNHIFFNNSLANQNTASYKDVYLGFAFSGKGTAFTGKTSDFNTSVQTYFTALNAL